MEIRIDDMLVKSKQGKDHVAHLSKELDTLQKFQLKLNPSKCVFGASAGKYLEFLVSQRGIEIDHNQIKPLIEMRTPQSRKDVQYLNGRLATLNRFISKASDRCLPFFKALRGEGPVSFFLVLKNYLGSPELLSTPKP